MIRVNAMQKYAFMDRDGTIIREPGRDKDNVAIPLRGISEVKFLDGVITGLQQLTRDGYKLVLVSNQDYLGTTRNPQDIFDTVMDYTFKELKQHGINFEYVMICPHSKKDNCNCKKPKIGGLKHFLEDRKGKVDLTNSLMFGDRDTDKEFAENLGVKFVQVETNGQFIVPDDI